MKMEERVRELRNPYWLAKLVKNYARSKGYAAELVLNKHERPALDINGKRCVLYYAGNILRARPRAKSHHSKVNIYAGTLRAAEVVIIYQSALTIHNFFIIPASDLLAKLGTSRMRAFYLRLEPQAHGKGPVPRLDFFQYLERWDQFDSTP